MKLGDSLELHAGGAGSGCNPAAGHCGRPAGSHTANEKGSVQMLKDAGWNRNYAQNHREWSHPQKQHMRVLTHEQGWYVYHKVKTPTGEAIKPVAKGAHADNAKLFTHIHASVDAGGPGSGCRGENCGPKEKGAKKEKKWKDMTREERLKVARNDPRQKSLFDKEKLDAANVKVKKSGFHKPNPSLGHGVAKNTKVSNRSLRFENEGAEPPPGGIYQRSNGANKKFAPQAKLAAEGDEQQHAHMEPAVLPMHPPSLKNPDHVPVDGPRETDNRFLDVTKRREAEPDRINILKKGQPSSNKVPVVTTLVPHHMGALEQYGMYAQKTRVRQRPAKTIGAKRTHIPYDRRGSA